MEKLTPLTISKSITGAATVVLTKSYETFLVDAPINPTRQLVYELTEMFCHHFHIPKLTVKELEMGDKKFICQKLHNGETEWDSWQNYLWMTKRHYNQFSQVHIFLRLRFLEVFFPIFNTELELLMSADKKLNFYVMRRYENVKSTPIYQKTSLEKVGLLDPNTRKFLSFEKKVWKEELKNFLALMDEDFYLDIKRLLQLYPDVKEEVIADIDICFDEKVMQMKSELFSNYFKKL